MSASAPDSFASVIEKSRGWSHIAKVCFVLISAKIMVSEGYLFFCRISEGALASVTPWIPIRVSTNASTRMNAAFVT